ncbi:heparinase II/III family protein [Yoonia sp. BS5-3]|uniref:Heparinase II/III family protein n=1 Tax=Yoonia phaeophyticola TaxID=3137369 RepID=A0ABZ3IDV9_9RHOB
MAHSNTWRARWTIFMHRVQARRSARGRAVTAFVSAPEPRSIGIVSRGRQLIAGNFLFSGLLVEGPNLSIWDIAAKNPDVAGEIHGCAWLDDLAAIGDERARRRAQRWVFEWIDLYGKGTGSGWFPDLTGRRLIRWINHGFFLLRGQEKPQSDLFFQSLARQMQFLSRRAQVTPPGLSRFEALAGTIYAGLSLEGMAHHVARAAAALAKDCDTEIDPSGAIATRNPEELLEILTLLNWTVEALHDANHDVPRAIERAIDRIVPVLRALRHADGALARFHGGGAGLEGRAEQAFAASGVKTLPEPGLHMGFARLTGGRSSILVDAAAPPRGDLSVRAHASTLGMELTSARRPVIVGCGSGARFGDEWRRASRATPSHSTLSLDGVSSSELGTQSDQLTKIPTLVRANADDPRRLELSHNGYQPSHGLTHARILSLSIDGRMLTGEDLLTALDSQDESRFDSINVDGVAFSVRFHLHPDVEATLDMGGTAVSLRLKSGETWVFRHDGVGTLTLAPSVYLQNGRLKPRATQQVVLSGRAMSYATRVRWSLAKAQDTPTAVRDLEQADPMDVTE